VVPRPSLEIVRQAYKYCGWPAALRRCFSGHAKPSDAKTSSTPVSSHCFNAADGAGIPAAKLARELDALAAELCDLTVQIDQLRERLEKHADRFIDLWKGCWQYVPRRG